MKTLDDAGMLAVWDVGAAASMVLRPAVLYDMFELGGNNGPQGTDLAIGARDRALMEARAHLFGPEVTCIKTCAACDEQIEISFNLNDLASTGQTPSMVKLRLVEGDVQLRLPTTADVARALKAPVPERPACLIRSCALTTLPDPLSETLIAEASAILQEADPDAEIELAATCPTCSTLTSVMFDVGACLWDDVLHAAWRIIRQIDRFARDYGWTEAQILAIPSRRRLAYLRLREG